MKKPNPPKMRPSHEMNVYRFDPVTGAFEVVCPICGRVEIRGADVPLIVWVEGDSRFSHSWFTGGLKMESPEVKEE